MRRVHGCALLLGAALLGVVACQKEAAGPTAAEYQKQRAAILEKHKTMAKAEPAGAKKGEKQGPGADAATAAGMKLGATGWSYDATGKRDPFRSFILDRLNERESDIESPLEKFDLGQLELSAVVWEAAKKRALILDPSGQTYIVAEGDPIGKNDGEVISIGDSVMLVRESYVDFHGTQSVKEIEMRIRQSTGG
jgi:Tfp pilus assembly protein PilP